MNAIETGKHQEVNLILKQYKDDYGLVKFENVLSIPKEQRIPALAKQDFMRINMLIIGALTMVFKSLNLKNGLNEFQILDLSEAIIDTSNEDNLSFEDLMLFLQKLTRGEYEMSETMNIPKFMKIFEIYREERFQQLRNIRLDKESSFKVSGDTNRICKTNELAEHFSNMAGRISELNSKLREQRQENKELRDE